MATVMTARRTTSPAEEVPKAVAAELGLGRAMEILEGERARVRAVMGGVRRWPRDGRLARR